MFFLILQKTKSFRKKSLGDLNIGENNNKGICRRIFLVEAPCAMSPRQLPLNAKPRHLFLFSDLLLVAKPRSGGTFKLKVIIKNLKKTHINELCLDNNTCNFFGLNLKQIYQLEKLDGKHLMYFLCEKQWIKHLRIDKFQCFLSFRCSSLEISFRILNMAGNVEKFHDGAKPAMLLTLKFRYWSRKIDN